MAKTEMCVALSGDSKSLAMKACAPTDSAQQWYLSRRTSVSRQEYVSMKGNCVKGTCTFGHCQCEPGFQGAACDVDTCSLLRCNNDGKCVLGQCKCADGFTGPFCDSFIKCKGVKCLNGGKCSRDGKCECRVGWSGQRCQDKHPNVLVRALNHQALGLEGGLVSAVNPDVRNKEHVWVWDSVKKMLRPSGLADMCLQQTTDNTLALSMCNTTRDAQKWNYDAAKGRLTAAATPALMLGFEETMTGACALV
ncbi:hypothetical protein PINS_up023061 [Pythium insidiosum]|nr:hypothetical protein PINS_up023061 [Pythium insidiosum]